MPAYAYNPALRPPGSWGGIDFSDQKLGPALQLMVHNLSEKVQDFEPAKGIRLTRQAVRSADGAEIPFYLFEPENPQCIRGNLLYCHGGGFFLPVQPMMMSLACEFAQVLSLRVYLPEYRLLPDYPNPCAFEDCCAVLEELLSQGLPYLLYGESVGGTLAAGLSLRAERKGLQKACGQCLIYPVLDNHCSRYPSMREYSEAAWPLRSNLTMWLAYLKPGLLLPQEYLIPMKALSLSGLPDSYIEPQEIDTVRDEAVRFAELLEEAGVPVTLRTVPGSYHGFDEDLENPFVREIVSERIAWMQQKLN